MTDAPSTREEKIRSFWDRYINKLYESGIKPPFDRWMVRRAEHYVAVHSDRRLIEQTPVDVDAYLAELGRKPGLRPWQLRQAVDAIQILFELAGVSWLGEVDWEHWRDSAQALEATHPTVARDYSPLPGSGSPGAGLASGGGETAGQELSLAAIRATQGPLLDQVTKTLRVRGLAIRTEGITGVRASLGSSLAITHLVTNQRGPDAADRNQGCRAIPRVLCWRASTRGLRQGPGSNWAS